MIQTFYALIAMMVLAIISLTVNTKLHGGEQRLMVSELANVMTGVGSDFLDVVSSRPYDPVALMTTTVAVISNPNFLLPSSTFGLDPNGNPVGCDPDLDYFACMFVSDFHGSTATRTVTRTFQGQAYTATYTIDNVTVRYVDSEPPHAPLTDPNLRSFAKEVRITVSNPDVRSPATGAPIELGMSRIITYPNL
jgi:hypothetical protein